MWLSEKLTKIIKKRTRKFYNIMITRLKIFKVLLREQSKFRF